MRLYERVYEDVKNEIGLIPCLGCITMGFLCVISDIHQQNNITSFTITKWIGFTCVFIIFYYLGIKYQKDRIKRKSFNDVIQRIKNLPEGLNILYTLYKFPQQILESKNCFKKIPTKYDFAAGTVDSDEYNVESDLFWTTPISDLIIFFSKIKIDDLNYIIRFNDVESRNFEFNENLYNYLEKFFKKVSLKEIDDLVVVVDRYKNLRIL